MHAVNTENNAAKVVVEEKALPMWKIVLSQFVEHKLAVASCFAILFLVLIAVFANQIEAITGLHPDSQNVAQRYLPPFSSSESNSGEKESAIEQYIMNNPQDAEVVQKALVEKQVVSVAEADALYELAVAKPETKEAIQALKDLNIPEARSLIDLFDSFSSYHLVGTDELGRDVFIRLVYGTRISMGVGILVALASALIGLLIGSLAGYYGGFMDALLMRVTDALLSLPLLPFQIMIAAIDLGKLPAVRALINPEYESIIKMVFILCLFSWMPVARLVRGSILSIREREFVLAAKTLGATDSTIIVRHMFPNVVAPMLVSITLGVGESILFESALSFLGLGIMPPTPSWGNMLNNAQELIYQAPFLAIIPGILILITTVSFNYLGDGLQDALDPKAIRR